MDYQGMPATLQVVNSLGQVLDVQQYDALPAEPVVISMLGIKAGLYHVTVEVGEMKMVAKGFVVGRE